MTTLATCWSMVINNPEDNDFTLVRQMNKDYIRQLIWTPEVGKDGTPHIQAYVRLQKQQRMSFIKKLFPRGHFKSITKDEYDLNTQTYVQKNDQTTAGLHSNTVNDPIPSVDSLLKTVVERIPALWHERELERHKGHQHGQCRAKEPCEMDFDTLFDSEDYWLAHLDIAPMKAVVKNIEKSMVLDNPRTAKLFVSPTYTKIKKEYFPEIFLAHILNAPDDSQEGDEVGSGRHSIPHAAASQSSGDDDQGNSGEVSDGTSEGTSEEASSVGTGD